MKGNKWNAANFGPKLVISENGLGVKHLGPFGKKINVENFIFVYFKE